MAAFCAFFPWCTPDEFWNLDLDEYQALHAVWTAAQQGQKGH